MLQTTCVQVRTKLASLCRHQPALRTVWERKHLRNTGIQKAAPSPVLVQQLSLQQQLDAASQQSSTARTEARTLRFGKEGFESYQATDLYGWDVYTENPRTFVGTVDDVRDASLSVCTRLRGW